MRSRREAGRGDVTRTGGTLVFTGSMDWRPNIDGLEWLMDEAWARIVAASPNTTLVVVGRDPPRRLVAEAARRGLAWTFTGLVDDVRPFVHAADVCVIPLRTGGGTRLKVYEAMALGCPVVSTTRRRRGAAARRRRALRPRGRRPRVRRRRPPPAARRGPASAPREARRASTSPRTFRRASSAAPSKRSVSKVSGVDRVRQLTSAGWFGGRRSVGAC